MLNPFDFDILFAGIVSEDTLKSEHLINAFNHVLRWLDHRGCQFITDEDRDLYKMQELYTDEISIQEHVDILISRLDAIANEYGYQFSAHPDDGACFGFWKLDD